MSSSGTAEDETPAIKKVKLGSLTEPKEADVEPIALMGCKHSQGVAESSIGSPRETVKEALSSRAIEPVDASTEAKVKLLKLTCDDEPLTIRGTALSWRNRPQILWFCGAHVSTQSLAVSSPHTTFVYAPFSLAVLSNPCARRNGGAGCYKLQSDRAARYAAVTDTEGKVLFPQLGLAGGGIAVTCTTNEGEIVETIVDAELEHCVLEDPITLSEVLLPALVEAQFESRGEGSDLFLAVLPLADWAAPMGVGGAAVFNQSVRSCRVNH
jgi:hypothetical protein